jgi:hypothetical protein
MVRQRALATSQGLDVIVKSRREIAAKEIHQSRPSAARISLSIESKGRLPILTQIFGFGHIVAFPHSVIFEVDI